MSIQVYDHAGQLYEADLVEGKKFRALERENARIKANHGCARNQGTTQFCAEVLAVQNERDQWHALYREEADKRAKAEAQRDELRKHADAMAGLVDDEAIEAITAYRASRQRPGL